MKFKKSSKGFTLVEVIVSVSIIGVMMVFFTQIISANLGLSSKAWEYEQATYDFSAVIDTDGGIDDGSEFLVSTLAQVNIDLSRKGNGGVNMFSIFEKNVTYADLIKAKNGSLIYYEK